MIFDAIIGTSNLNKGEGASLKTPALVGEKSATLTFCYSIYSKKS
jgi:hypothetical protein